MYRQELEHARAALDLKKSENAQRQKEVERIEDYEARIKEVRDVVWPLRYLYEI